MTSSTRVRRTVTRVGVVAAAGALALAAVPAAHAAPGDLTVTYDAVGTTHITKPNIDIALTAPLVATVTPTGDVTGSLALPPSATTFKILGFVPVSSTVNFVPSGDGGGVTGTLLKNKVNTKAQFIIKLTDVKAAGIPLGQGNACVSKTPAVIPAVTPKGEKFSVVNGGNLTGTYTIPEFVNCGLFTGIINMLVPGPDNTLKIAISNGRITS